MSSSPFQDAALVLVAHGSSLNAGSGVPAYLHGDALRARGLFAEIREAFLQQDPPVSGVLRRVSASRVFVVPLFISEGWFTEQVIPMELGLRGPGSAEWSRVRRDGARTIFYAHPVGSHPLMTEVLLARARDVVTAHPRDPAPVPARTSLLIAGHGTGYSRGSRQSIERQVALLRDRGIYRSVDGIFLEEPPFIRDAWGMVAEEDAVLVPFFMSDGLHTQEDIPQMLGEAQADVLDRLAAGSSGWPNPTRRHGKRLWCASAVGSEPALGDVILERVREAAAWDAGG